MNKLLEFVARHWAAQRSSILSAPSCRTEQRCRAVRRISALSRAHTWFAPTPAKAVSARAEWLRSSPSAAAVTGAVRRPAAVAARRRRRQQHQVKPCSDSLLFRASGFFTAGTVRIYIRRPVDSRRAPRQPLGGDMTNIAGALHRRQR